MNKIVYEYPKHVEKVFKEWEYLRLQFKDSPEYVKFIDKTIIELKRIAIPMIIIKKEKK